MRLKELRLEKGLTQKAVAEVIGCSASTYPKYEREEREPDRFILWRLADFYKVTVDYLIGRSDKRGGEDSGKE